LSKNCTLVPFDAAEGLTLQQAAAVAGKSQRTLRNWCIEHGIGRRVADGTWVVSRVALAMCRRLAGSTLGEVRTNKVRTIPSRVHQDRGR
jgi:hypothetical protein